MTATTRKLAVLFYNALRHGMAYSDPGAAQYEERYRSRVIGNLQRRAAGFGASLTRLADVGGFTAAGTHTLHDFVTALSMAAGGYGVVLGPASMRQHGISGVVFRPIADFTDEVGLAIAYRTSESSAAARAFASLTRDIARPST